MLLEVSSQVLPHRLICFVFFFAHIAAELEELSMFVDVQAHLVFVISCEWTIVTVEKERGHNKLFFKVIFVKILNF